MRARVVLGLAGCVLMTAALLKLAGWNVSAFAQYGWFLTPNVQIAAVGWELILGACLLFGVHRPVTWLLAILTFASFAAVSSYLGIIGQASCGCFGTIEASPWLAFGVDVGMILLLGLFHPRFATADLRTASLESGKWAVGLAIVLLLAVVAGILLYGSPSAALAKLRGDTLTVDRAHIDFGHGQAGDILTQQLTVTNWTDGTLRLTGGTSDCSCITTTNMPTVLAPRESKAIGIIYRIPHTDQPGITSRSATLLTDCQKQPNLALTLSANVD